MDGSGGSVDLVVRTGLCRGGSLNQRRVQITGLPDAMDAAARGTIASRQLAMPLAWRCPLRTLPLLLLSINLDALAALGLKATAADGEATDPDANLPDESPTVEGLLVVHDTKADADELVHLLQFHGIDSHASVAVEGGEAYAVFAKVQIADRLCGGGPLPGTPGTPPADPTRPPANPKAGDVYGNFFWDPWRVSDGPIPTLGAWIPAGAAYTTPPPPPFADGEEG